MHKAVLLRKKGVIKAEGQSGTVWYNQYPLPHLLHGLLALLGVVGVSWELGGGEAQFCGSEWNIEATAHHGSLLHLQGVH